MRDDSDDLCVSTGKNKGPAGKGDEENAKTRAGARSWLRCRSGERYIAKGAYPFHDPLNSSLILVSIFPLRVTEFI